MSVSSRIRRRSSAERDLVEQVEHFIGVTRDVELAARFVDAVERGLRFLLENPKVGASIESANPRLEGVRR